MSEKEELATMTGNGHILLPAKINDRSFTLEPLNLLDRLEFADALAEYADKLAKATAGNGDYPKPSEFIKNLGILVWAHVRKNGLSRNEIRTARAKKDGTGWACTLDDVMEAVDQNNEAEVGSALQAFTLARAPKSTPSDSVTSG